MNWKALTLVLLMPPAACQTITSAYNVITGVSITQDQLDAAVLAYDAAILTPFNVYRYSDAAFRVPRRYCTSAAPFTVASPCANYSVLAKMQPYLRAVDAAERKLQATVTNCNVAHDQSACTGFPAAIALFKDAVSAAQTAKGSSF